MGFAGDDRSLLARLNALKQSSVTLDDGSNSLSAATTSPVPASSGLEPASREDALSARLRTLRNSPSPSHAASPSLFRAPGSPSPVPAKPQDPASEITTPVRKSPYRIPPHAATETNLGGLDELLPPVDRQALDELLEGLEFDPEAELGDDGGSDVAAADADEELDLWEGVAAQEDTRKVKRLIAEFQQSAAAASCAGDTAHEAETADDEKKADEEDDPEDEHTRREVGRILSEAREEAELDRRVAADHQPDGISQETSSTSHAQKKKVPGADRRDPEQLGTEQGSGNGLTLPNVPIELVDPVLEDDEDSQTAESRGYQDFENDITARMAALKGIGSTDAFGLPAAPTFQPEERTPDPARKKQTAADPDFCLICFEDAAIRCIGCEDDVYCTRCWRDTHVGPRAGYDERGHRWVKLNTQDSGPY